MSIKILLYSIVFFVFVILSQTFGQSPLPGERTPSNSYYLDLNTLSSSTVSEILQAHLSIKYNDQHGKSEELMLKIFNWKHKEIAKLMLTKSYGLNYYNIDLNDVYNEWEFGAIYSCEASNEEGKKYKLLFKPVEPYEKQAQLADIFVNPISLQCDKGSSATIEYYGEINGGKAPYEVTWYIMNDKQTNLLYQPREEHIAKPGHTLVVTIDAVPDYYVLMKVKDACGNFQQQMVHMVCEYSTEKINTIFVQPLDKIIPTKIGK